MSHWLSLLFSDCGFPKFTVAVMVPQNLFMLALFSDFYYKAYVKKAKTEIKANGKIKEQLDENQNVVKESSTPTKVQINGDARNRLSKVYANGNANGNVISH